MNETVIPESKEVEVHGNPSVSYLRPGSGTIGPSVDF